MENDSHLIEPKTPQEPQSPPRGGARIRRIALYGAAIFCLFVVLVFALLFPVIQREREAARQMGCTTCLKQIWLGMHLYHDVYGCLPPAYTVDSEGKPLHSWRTLLLPYLEQQELYEKIRLDEPWDSAWNRQFANVNLRRLFRCPTGAAGDPSVVKDSFLDPDHSTTSGDCYYSVVIGEGTCFPGDKTVTLNDITDGTSNTVLAVERTTPINWMVPDKEITLETALKGINPAGGKTEEKTEGKGKVGSVHTGKTNVAFVDGTIRFLRNDIDPKVWKSMLLINDSSSVR